ncbi:MAG: PhzF family phenazine biosynthesis protein [Ignavibacteriae bacterium]|nr:MAG: PhzF family phenazine biosynthesis protein [Ignavibacteriota bacterium]
MKLPIYTVDAFTSKPFKGNPAAVCILENEIEEQLMKNIAFELNLSETAFVRKTGDTYSLRWFTPAMEVDLCGHATLASSHILWETERQDKNKEIIFNTRSGELKASRKENIIQLDFPLIEQKEIAVPPELEKALGAKPNYCGMTEWNYVIEFENEDMIKNMQPDFELLQSLPAWGTIVTAKGSSDGYDFVSRFFAPEKGVKEDPVTGSAHCALGPYWMKRLGKNTFKAYQASARGGEVGVKVENGRVYLTGNAVTVIEGEITIKN